jgi:hypothetical protein
MIKRLEPFRAPFRSRALPSHHRVHGLNHRCDQRIFVVCGLDDRHDGKIDVALVMVPQDAF